MTGKPNLGVDELFPALERTDRSCRLILKQLRESYPDVLEQPEFERVLKLARLQLRENRGLLGTEPATVE